LREGDAHVITPQRLHHLEVHGLVTFEIDFYRLDGAQES